MSIENNTTTAPAATISEKELFEQFYESEYVEYNSRGKERHRFEIETLLQPSCDYCQVDFLIIPSEVDDPDDKLDSIENELWGAISDIRLARRAWDEFKESRLVEGEGDVERYSALASAEVA